MTASDIEEDALLFTKANVLKNNLQDLISVQHVDVARPGADPRFSDGVDIVAASEILYLDSLHRPLLNFLSRHLKKGGRAVFVRTWPAASRISPSWPPKNSKSQNATSPEP